MPNIIYEYVNEDGATIHIQAEEPNARPVMRGRAKEETVTKKIQMKFEEALGCLLYTSPSPRDRQKSRMPSSA